MRVLVLARNFSPDMGDEAINLACETETRAVNLANWINELTETEAGIIFRNRRDWDKVVKRRASIEKARKILGCEPKMGIEELIKKTVDWFLQNRAKIEVRARF